jgi:hypothetical protein
MTDCKEIRMAEERHTPHSLKKQTADQIRNEQRGGGTSPIAPERDPGPEANASMRTVWSQPGGEASNYRNAMVGAGGKSDSHGDLTAAETPETTRHLSDASLPPKKKPDGPAKDANPDDAIERATAVNGKEPGRR